MTTDITSFDPTVAFPTRWVPVEYRCACGRKILVGAQFISGPFAAPEYQHECGQDETHIIPGPIFAAWEELDGRWVRTS